MKRNASNKEKTRCKAVHLFNTTLIKETVVAVVRPTPDVRKFLAFGMKPTYFSPGARSSR